MSDKENKSAPEAVAPVTALTHSPTIREVIKQAHVDPRMAEVGYQFINLAGGAAGFADMLWKEYKKAPDGGMARIRILDIVTRCLKVGNDQDPRGSLDTGLLTDEDIERQLQIALKTARA